MSTLEKFRVTGGGPKFIRIGSRSIGYLLEDLDDFINSRRRVSSTADYAEPEIEGSQQ
jgi:hypothetical protein